MTKYSGPVSIQLWSTRDSLSLDEQFAQIREDGFTDVQPFHDQYEDVESLKVAMDRHGLSCMSGHFRIDMFDGDAAPVIQAAKALGMDLVVAPWLEPEDRPTDVEGWKAVHRRLCGIRDVIHAAGLRFAWHNHDFEFVELPDGSFGIEHLLGDDILFAVDIAWIQRAGQDPLPWLRRYAGRIPAVHVKDIAPAGENEDQMGFADVGHGVMDWAALWQLLNELDVSLRIVEHDQPGDWRRFTRRSGSSFKNLMFHNDTADSKAVTDPIAGA